MVLAEDAANRDCGYPSSIQLPNGKIVTMYYQVDDANNTPGSAKAKVVIWSASGAGVKRGAQSASATRP